MTIIATNEKLSSKEVVAPSRFEDTESYLAALLFGSNSAAVQLGSKFVEVNTDA